MKIISLIIVPFLILVLFFLLNNFSKKPTPKSAPPDNPAVNTTVSQGNIPDIPFQLPSGFTINLYASGLGNPRDLTFSQGGTLLVSSPNSDEVLALPDKNQDRLADAKKVIIDGANNPHGLAFHKGKLFVAETDQVVRYNWDENNLEATKEKVLFPLPKNNGHNRRTIVFGSDRKMYVSVGSTCNVCKEASFFSGTVIVSDAEGNDPKVFAKGLRNAAFIQINPSTGELWGTEMGRDFLGDNLPPDEINIIRQDLDYGWPYCYGEKIHDDNFDPNNANLCDNTQPPIYEIPAHSAPLGLTFINSSQFPTDWQGNLLIAYHGSWNRSSPIGYKVVRLKVSVNNIAGGEDFLTGFLPKSATNGPESAFGRPADLEFDSLGNLFLSDDKAGNIYIIQKSK